MEILRREELEARFDSRQSFYGKALIKYADNGDIILQSYSTDVAVIHADGTFEAGKYSQTTNRHIREFMKQFNIDLKLFK